MLACLAGLPYFTSCTSQQQQQEDDAKLAAKEDDEDEEDDDADGKAGTLPHPEKATAWATRNLIATHPQPSNEKVAQCMDDLAKIAADAGNPQDMLQAQVQAANLAAADVGLYHYCFYQLMVRLDERLERGGPLMADVATVFFDTMRALWILARGLDVATGRERYFPYLRERYVQLSKQHFGRDVEVVGPPMGIIRPGDQYPSQVKGKPAGAAQVE